LISNGVKVLAVEPNIKSHPEFDVLDYRDAIDRADLIAILVPHREFVDLNIVTDLNFCNI